MKRLLDLVLSISGLIITSPLFLVIAILILLDSRGGIIYKSKRVGKNQKPFDLYKFRSMYPNSDKSSITVGNRDPRITKTGYWLRKYKLDELPQLVNVLKGEMSFVGPRPDVPVYSDYYIREMPEYYQMKPGITSYSSLHFANESELYTQVTDPEKVYITQTIPEKIRLDREYYKNMGVFTDIRIILKTLSQLFIK
jgi:lipopolysaccharide/colanic/teichoic acid biosynthesis glycosyltransferase